MSDLLAARFLSGWVEVIHFSRFGVVCGVWVCLTIVSYIVAFVRHNVGVCKTNLLDISKVHDKQAYNRFCLYVIQTATAVIQ